MSQLYASGEKLEVYSDREDINGPTELLKIAGIAHELGNLIQIASSAVNIIARRAGSHEASNLDPAISGARMSLDRAGHLVRQAMRRDGHTVRSECVDVAHSLAGVRDLIQYTWAPKHHVAIVPSTGPLAVRCARVGLQGAILNLALNARDSMPDGGTISLGAVIAFQGSAQPLVELRVSDNGFGMTPETINRAFDPFFTTKSMGLGGVGLPMVKRFVQEAGGSIKIESEPGIGTTVMLRLPVFR